MTGLSRLAVNPELARQHAAHLARQMRCGAAQVRIRKGVAFSEQHDAHVRCRAVCAVWFAPSICRETSYVGSQIEHVTTWRRRVLRASSPGTRAIKVVAAAAAVSTGDLCGARRTMNLVRPRQVAAFILHRHLAYSLPRAGRRLGDRDHTTILHAVRKIEALLTHCSQTQAMVAAVLRELGGEA